MNRGEVLKIVEKAKKKGEQANLKGADLYGANLYGANLYGANLTEANLYGANLRGANLRGADLYGANLYGANFTEANLYGANLRGANLRGADLYGANLYGANFTEANLKGANLRGANLRGADLYGADLEGAKGLETFRIVPEEGSFIGWKKVKYEVIQNNFFFFECVILKLEIPYGAKRVNAYGSRKCRASSARVLSITKMDGKPYRGKEELVGTHYNGVIYERGKLVKADSFDPDPRAECSNGIHFFLTKQEAMDWQ